MFVEVDRDIKFNSRFVDKVINKNLTQLTSVYTKNKGIYGSNSFIPFVLKKCVVKVYIVHDFSGRDCLILFNY